ncbi:acyl-CoA thioesterase II [Amycolatopsis rubida]|uniref:Acyl-CoA thioesterase 2 n=1 Tax=Amycolatopsis rubida TaxID=112413 RepID=A0A1I6BHY5_9PSEU|nr:MULTISPECIES: acyl-CoA thioesterase II [Amycolatopsis]MYW93393.1 acyl-CoA thioesterase II [Amycolatopsis rubida]NEC58380.1 acyl-CoA thioesterase II [Amycolatopsis rubida]OAP20203.1 Acyl-CoA thioesterase 2 [Amycolatopsis sp. M39]SFQ80560.1 acyl-CoA thioesterase-2 [Amycolatopsis rubida]
MTEMAREAATELDTSPGGGGQPVLDKLVALLDLEKIEENIYRGVSPAHSSVRVFGGQVAGQALVAAGRTVPEERRVHSLHAYFIRGGDPSVPIVYEVDRIRDGRSFTTRRVVAVQHGKAIFSLSASFQKDEPGIDHAETMPAGVPDPESLPTFPELTAGYGLRFSEIPRPIDIRYVGEPPWVTRTTGERPAHHRVWMRADGALADNQLLHVCVLTYASDMTLLDSVLARHGVYWDVDKVLGASLDHALWFHRPFRADEWFLYDSTSPSASGARGLATGRFFTRDGLHVATVVQEGLLRVR